MVYVAGTFSQSVCRYFFSICPLHGIFCSVLNHSYNFFVWFFQLFESKAQTSLPIPLDFIMHLPKVALSVDSQSMKIKSSITPSHTQSKFKVNQLSFMGSLISPPNSYVEI